MRDTSLEAYKNLIQDGTLKRLKAVVYNYIYNHGPTTQKKAERAFADVNSSISPRFAELEKLGLISIVGKVFCEETNTNNISWDVTNRVNPLVLKKEKKASKKQLEEIKVLAFQTFNWLRDNTEKGKPIPMETLNEFSRKGLLKIDGILSGKKPSHNA